MPSKMCIPTSFKLEIIEDDPPCKPCPPRKKRRRRCVDEKKRTTIVEEDVIFVEITPGQVARLYDPKKKQQIKQPVRFEDVTIDLKADHWLCAGCETFVAIQIDICIQCGRPRYPRKEEPRPTPPTAPRPCEGVNYDKLKEIMLETGESIAKDVLSKEQDRDKDRKDDNCDPPKEIPVPYPVLIRDPSSSSSGSSVSRRSFDRVRRHVHHLSDRMTSLGNRTGALRADLNGVADGFRGIATGLGNVTGRINRIEQCVDNLEQRRERAPSRGRSNRRCEEWRLQEREWQCDARDRAREYERRRIAELERERRWERHRERELGREIGRERDQWAEEDSLLAAGGWRRVRPLW